MNEKIKELAEQAGLDSELQNHWAFYNFDLERFAELVRQDEREACLACYSLDDTANDWADKIRSRGEK